MTPEEVQKLADLARIRISEGEQKKLQKDLETILKYVAQIGEVSGPRKSAWSPRKSAASNAAGTFDGAASLRNVMRQDGEPHETGAYSDALLEAVPEREGEYVKVKKIL